MSANPLEAYSSAQKATTSGRDIESLVLHKAAMKLKECRDNWTAADRNEKLDEALKFNQLIWSIFQGELSKEENQLPMEIKTNLLTLSVFIDKRIFDAMSYPAPEKLDVLININTNIASGLALSAAEAV